MNIKEAIQQAIESHQAGNLQKAENIYKEILSTQPNNFYALHYLGVLYSQLGNYDLAIVYIEKALQVNPSDPHAYYNLGIACQSKGRLDEAITAYQKALELNPTNADAYVNLGIVFKDKGEIDHAITYYRKALQLNPNLIAAQYNLGYALQVKGELDEAITCYQNALQLNPTFAAAYYNLGYCYQNKNNLDEAISSYQKALQINPNIIDAYRNLGLSFYDKGLLDKAIHCFKNALHLNPDFVDAYYNLGTVFQEKGQLDDATNYYQKALRINPNLADAYNGLGVIFQKKGLLDDAIIHYQKAIELAPTFADAFSNLGTTLKEQGKLDEAIIYIEKALRINPNIAEAHNSLGNILYNQGKINEAIAAYDLAIDIKPNYAKARLAKCMSQLPIIYSDPSDIEISRQRYHEELIKLQEMLPLKTSVDIKTAIEAVGIHQPFYLAYQGLNNKELQQIYGNLVYSILSSGYPQFSTRPPMPSPLYGKPIRIGIISRFFYYHSVWKIPLGGWIEKLDKERFSLYGYYTGRTKDNITEVARKHCRRFVEDVYSFEDLCRIIRDDNLHIIIYPEIGMDPVSLRLAALWLAPIQCAFWGHPSTTGLPTIDYYLSSDLMEPPGADKHYTERLIRLPNLSFYYNPPEMPLVELNRDTFGLRQKFILYHCCQALFKFLPQYDEVFPLIAQQVGNCQFLFSSFPENKHIIERFRLRITQAFDRFNLNVDDYVVFLPFLDKVHYNALNTLSDIFLDPIGWSGCNSALEAIACNLPIVTFPGELMRSRDSFAILTMMELKETIAATLDEYVEIAVKLGRDAEWRSYVSERIASDKHRIYRDRTCITTLENFFEKVVKERL